MMTRRDLLSLLPAAATANAAPRSQPNVLILFTDDHRYDCIGALGHPDLKTPNLDRLYARSTVFTHAFNMGGTVGAICVPSRAMIMTGRTLFHADAAIVRPSAKAAPYHYLANQLREAGYAVFHTGKWHLGPREFNKAFNAGENIFFGGMDDHSRTVVQDYDPTAAYPKTRARNATKFSSELFADTAIRFLESRKGQTQPFFLNVCFTSPHDPRMAPKRFEDLYSPDRITPPPNLLPEHPFDNGELRVRDEMLAPHPRPVAQVRQHIASYYAMISEVDAQIGRILDALDASGHAANTIVVFAGDNGLAVGQHGLMGKQNPYDHSWRVPLALSGPGIPRGKRRDDLVYLYDVHPTLYELTGVVKPATVEFQSLFRAPRRPHVFFAYRDFQRALRTRSWKLHWYKVKGQETTRLFDIQNDPWEMRPIEDPKRTAEMRALLEAEMKRLEDPLAS